MGKRILFNEEAKRGVMDGINIVADAVKVTLGAGGRTVIVSDGNFPTRTTKDGVTVARSIDLSDDITNAGAKMIKEVSSKTAEDVGDGTTTVCVLMQALVTRGHQLINSGVNPVLLKRGMEKAVKTIVHTLENYKSNIDNNEQLNQVAAISANNDPEIGNLIGEVFSKIGKSGIVNIEDSKDVSTTIKIIDGFNFNCGFYHEMFISNLSNNTCEIENPYVLMLEDKLMNPEHIISILNKVAKEKRGLVIFAEDFDARVIGVIMQNISKIPASCIKYDYTGETKEELMRDLCAMTSAELVTFKKGMKLEELKTSWLGECEKIISDKKETTIYKGKKSEELLASRIEDAKVKIQNAKHPFEKQLRERRLAKLNGWTATCYVGGNTEVERSEKCDRVDDSIRATKAAIEEGIVPGAGTALLYCIPHLDNITGLSADEQAGVDLVKYAIEIPAKQICKNAGANSELIIERIKERISTPTYKHDGYDVISGRTINLVQAGIIDPKKVVRVCVENSVSAAAQFLLSQTLIVNEKN